MGNRKTSGLTKRGGVWHIDKMFRGVRICESTGTDDLEKAEEQLAQRMLTIRDAQIFGVRTERTFRAEEQRKKPAGRNAGSDVPPSVALAPLLSTRLLTCEQRFSRRGG
jgi:hypothetical protein